jgi:hypothetical protein
MLGATLFLPIAELAPGATFIILPRDTRHIALFFLPLIISCTALLTHSRLVRIVVSVMALLPLPLLWFEAMFVAGHSGSARIGSISFHLGAFLLIGIAIAEIGEPIVRRLERGGLPPGGPPA